MKNFVKVMYQVNGFEKFCCGELASEDEHFVYVLIKDGRRVIVKKENIIEMRTEPYQENREMKT